jgi:hypothetical protein
MMILFSAINLLIVLLVDQIPTDFFLNYLGLELDEQVNLKIIPFPLLVEEII